MCIYNFSIFLFSFNVSYSCSVFLFFFCFLSIVLNVMQSYNYFCIKIRHFRKIAKKFKTK